MEVIFTNEPDLLPQSDRLFVRKPFSLYRRLLHTTQANYCNNEVESLWIFSSHSLPACRQSMRPYVICKIKQITNGVETNLIWPSRAFKHQYLLTTLIYIYIRHEHLGTSPASDYNLQFSCDTYPLVNSCDDNLSFLRLTYLIISYLDNQVTAHMGCDDI